LRSNPISKVDGRDERSMVMFDEFSRNAMASASAIDPIAGESADPATLARLVSLGVRSDQIADVLGLLWSELERPTAVLDRHHLALVSLPPADPDTDVEAPPWRVMSLTVGREPFGHLAVLAEPPLRPAEEALVQVARSLLADQLHRLSLAAWVLDERRSALKSRLAGDAKPTFENVREESERAHMPLADHYWPAILYWQRGEMPPALLAGIDALVHRHAPEHVTIRHDERTIIILLALDPPDSDHELQVRYLVEQIVELARSGLPGSCPKGIIAEGAAPLSDVAAKVEDLRRLCRFIGSRERAGDANVLSAQSFALHSLLETVDRRRAFEFVSGEIGRLVAYDRKHGARLADTLEIALDIPNRDEAARAAYMHRNTFRRHLHLAMELVGSDLAPPDKRLAVHVALKLRGVLGMRARDTRPAPRRRAYRRRR
jgi:sugar diacid utilization regulator